MSHTVEQAKELWCPIARFAAGDTEAYAANRFGASATPQTNPPACRCISQDCAMWRWLPVQPDRSSYPNAPRNPHRPPNPAHGYCGLAGKPEVQS